ncbi:hypothetical protein D9757_011100 [Collybiopsis confluens]|uniref:Uncharacterized protein n=1 Tax=Collybiopsis confluens TaxID=2823264 RepID=A0A8H5LX46_9AGAR|nr:hypothetical protein D9757_011100 [Collybiopsis confluens]
MTIPNATVSMISPAIPFQLLPSSIAYQTQIVSYILAGTSGAYIWDVLSNMNAERDLFCSGTNRYALTGYAMSRIGALVYVVGKTIYMTYPVGSCQVTQTVLDCFATMGTAGAGLLFFIRARAVFMANKRMVAFLAFLWIMVVASSASLPIATFASAVNIEDTLYCMTKGGSPSAGAGLIVSTVFDTVIFLSISYKLVASHSFTENHGFRDLILGANLSAFSKSILHEGQKYYLVTVLSNIATFALCNAPINSGLRAALTCPNTMLTSVMACYVYRKTVLGEITNPGVSFDAHIVPTINVQNVSPSMATHTTQTQSGSLSGKRGTTIAIEITTAIHVDDIEKVIPGQFIPFL